MQRGKVTARTHSLHKCQSVKNTGLNHKKNGSTFTEQHIIFIHLTFMMLYQQKAPVLPCSSQWNTGTPCESIQTTLLRAAKRRVWKVTAEYGSQQSTAVNKYHVYIPIITKPCYTSTASCWFAIWNFNKLRKKKRERIQFCIYKKELYKFRFTAAETHPHTVRAASLLAHSLPGEQGSATLRVSAVMGQGETASNSKRGEGDWM